MPQYLGVACAITALLCWGFGDFLLQKSARRFGDWESIFAMSFIGALVLAPFAVPTFIASQLSRDALFFLFLLSLSFFGGVFLGVEALKRGKLSIVESVGVVEIPIIGALSYLILAENLAPLHWLLVLLLLFGVLLVSLRTHVFNGRRWLEPGAFLGILAGIMFGVTGFLVGFVARETDPVMTVWGFNFVMAVVTFLYLVLAGRFFHFARDFRRNAALMTGVGVLDSFAWLAYAVAALYLPIVIAGVLSEGYIILATFLGILVNRETISRRQVLGILIAILGVVILSTLYS